MDYSIKKDRDGYIMQAGDIQVPCRTKESARGTEAKFRITDIADAYSRKDMQTANNLFGQYYTSYPYFERNEGLGFVMMEVRDRLKMFSSEVPEPEAYAALTFEMDIRDRKRPSEAFRRFEHEMDTFMMLEDSERGLVSDILKRGHDFGLIDSLASAEGKDRADIRKQLIRMIPKRKQKDYRTQVKTAL